jgi:hypothetical protein
MAKTRQHPIKDSRKNKENAMSVKSAFSAVGLAHKVCLAAEDQGYTPELLNALAEHPSLFQQLLQVQRGYAVFTQIEHVIDLDAAPFNPWEKEGVVIEEHQKGGQFKWDASQVAFHLADSQKNGIQGHKLRKELQGKPVLNANLLDYLLAHPELIPEDWKKDENGNTRYIFFWGTVYRNRVGNLFVRYLYWLGDRWDWSYRWLGSDWSGRSPVALRAS